MDASFQQVSLTMDEPMDGDILYGFHDGSELERQNTVTFELSCKCFINVWRSRPNRESGISEGYLMQVPHHVPSIEITVTRDQFRSHIDEVYQIFSNQLRQWPITGEGRRDVTISAFSRHFSAEKYEVPDSTSQGCDRLWIHCAFTLVISQITDEGSDVERVQLQSAEEAEAQMVPAAEASIELSLKKVVVADDSEETCSICLEVMRGSECEAMKMSCSHVFHGDCIRKWLRTSHYCPVCRFELPPEN
ncbi:uncharacterized protein LOC127250199 [Andrographis paniculata]|uniref:uncharacterized protein LOC127250199 n=1 Tax=Andrographis paniculata TaxID=175694 RepID=UPI0021E8D8E8|nr:uncharacterized protein LOC127250199 [Andrographis paniculata]